MMSNTERCIAEKKMAEEQAWRAMKPTTACTPEPSRASLKQELEGVEKNLYETRDGLRHLMARLGVEEQPTNGANLSGPPEAVLTQARHMSTVSFENCQLLRRIVETVG